MVCKVLGGRAMRKRFLVTVEVFVDPEWIEGETVTSREDVVWDMIDEMLPDTDDVGANVVKVRRVKR